MAQDRPKILVIRFSSLGDLVLLSSLLKALRTGYPEVDIHLACKEVYAEIFKGSSNVDRLHTLHGDGLAGLIRLHSKLRRERYGIIIDAHNVIRSNLIYRALRAPRKVQLGKEQTKKTLLIKRKRNLYNRIISQTARYLEIAGHLGIETRGISTGLEIPESAARKVGELIRGAGYEGKTPIAMAPGARWDTKRWPQGHYARLASELGDRGFETVLIGSKNELPLSEQIALGSSHTPLNLTGMLSIIETAAMLKNCSILVTNDSAPLHIAEAVGTPVVALFGPTVREFGYFPQLQRSAALEVELHCRPCSRNGSRPCPLETKECLTSITPEMVLEAVEDIVDSGKTGAETTLAGDTGSA